MFSDAMLSDINVVLCYVSSQYRCFHIYLFFGLLYIVSIRLSLKFSKNMNKRKCFEPKFPVSKGLGT
jgi:hypothetical protein